jgi:hypothetical protein
LQALPPVWLPEGLRMKQGLLHHCMLSCYGNSGSDPNRSTSAISAGSERPKQFIVHRSPYVYDHSELLDLWHRDVTPVLSHRCPHIKFYMTLRSATSASSSTHVQGRNPCVQSTRVHQRYPSNRYNIINR